MATPSERPGADDRSGVSRWGSRARAPASCPAPYTDHDARRYVHAALVPEELADSGRRAHVGRNLEHTARALQLPVGELVHALADIAGAALGNPLRPRR